MASLHAAAVGAIEPTGIAEFGDINHASGYDFMAEEIRRIGGRKLFLSTRNDIYGGGTRRVNGTCGNVRRRTSSCFPAPSTARICFASTTCSGNASRAYCSGS